MVDLAEMQRNAMRRWPTGVAIVTCRQGTAQHGMTVNSFTSLSLHPPRVGVTLADATRTTALVKASGYYGVTILADNQGHLADRFSGRIDQELDRFEQVETFELGGHAPFIRGGLAFFECHVVQQAPLGESTLFIAEVLVVEVVDSGSPLVYLNRIYHRLQV
jgi:flavin reductase (DIM6/NTAB) family NADH-FMN oxidoreductase RutF